MTPTQELLLQTLVARCRLGETCWTFSDRVRSQAIQLEKMGLVGWKSGIVEKTIIVWPTQALLDDTDWFTTTYRPPVVERLRLAVEMFLRVRGTFCNACVGESTMHVHGCEGSAVVRMNKIMEELK